MIGIEAIANLVNGVVDKIWPDANIDAQAKADALKAELTSQLQSEMGQLEINKIEAANPSVFVSGWRPLIGWVCGFGFAYEFLVMPVLNGVLAIFGAGAAFNPVASDSLEVLLYGMLGMAGLRSVERHRGIARHK